MRRQLGSIFAFVLVAGVSAGAASAQTIDIAISPQTVNLQFQGEWVTVHADIPYTLVEPDSVALDGIPADIEKDDDRGYLVAKFKMAGEMGEYLESFLDAGSATLTLTGGTIYGDLFSGSDTVRVIDRGGKRGK
jgi:hypothetical protein